MWFREAIEGPTELVDGALEGDHPKDAQRRVGGPQILPAEEVRQYQVSKGQIGHASTLWAPGRLGQERIWSF